MKTKEELDTLKEKIETVNKKLHELSEEELEKVSGGVEINTIGCSGMTHSAAVVEG